jgi:segregation and condensation protein B
LDNLELHIEAIIFTADSAVSVQEISAAINKAQDLELDTNVVLNHIENLVTKYESEKYPMHIIESGGGYQFLTKSEYHKTVSQYLNIKSKRRLSTAALETLAIIAYRQPVTKPEMEHIRGVNCDYAVQKLLEKELIEIKGRADSPGQPLIYGTSQNFMDYFGINSMKDLPELKEFEAGGDVLGIHPDLEKEQREANEQVAEAEAESDAAEQTAEHSEAASEQAEEVVETVESSETAEATETVEAAENQESEVVLEASEEVEEAAEEASDEQEEKQA